MWMRRDVEDAINQESDLDASDSDDDSDDSDEEDEEAALQAELAIIRAERKAAKAKADDEAAAEEQSQIEDAAQVGNPLLDSEPETTEKLKPRRN
jgi:protein CWC15